MLRVSASCAGPPADGLFFVPRKGLESLPEVCIMDMKQEYFDRGIKRSNKHYV